MFSYTGIFSSVLKGCLNILCLDRLLIIYGSLYITEIKGTMLIFSSIGYAEQNVYSYLKQRRQAFWAVISVNMLFTQFKFGWVNFRVSSSRTRILPDQTQPMLKTDLHIGTNIEFYILILQIGWQYAHGDLYYINNVHKLCILCI